MELVLVFRDLRRCGKVEENVVVYIGMILEL